MTKLDKLGREVTFYIQINAEIVEQSLTNGLGKKDDELEVKRRTIV